MDGYEITRINTTKNTRRAKSTRAGSIRERSTSPSRDAVRKAPGNVIDIRTKTKPKYVSKKQSVKPINSGYDFSVLFIVLTLLFFGIVMVFSSSYYKALYDPKFNDLYYFLKRQCLWAIIGICAMVITMNIDYHIYRRLAPLAYVGVLGLLVIVLFATAINGSSRWLEIGGQSLQPSEPAKIIIILFMSAIVANDRTRLEKFNGFIYYVMFLIPPIVLVGLANLSTAIVIAFVGFAVIFIASPKVWHFLVITLPVVLLGGVAVMLPQFAYRFDRIRAWLDPFSYPTDIGFQIVQSLYAVASGGLFGLGLGQSRQKLGYIPEAYNDIIFSVICEEFGLVGACALLALFMALVWRGIKIAINAYDLFGSLVAGGIVALIAVQVLINVAVNTNTIPTTGMPLPFISYGGSALLFLMASIGILLNISKYSKPA